MYHLYSEEHIQKSLNDYLESKKILGIFINKNWRNGKKKPFKFVMCMSDLRKIYQTNY